MLVQPKGLAQKLLHPASIPHCSSTSSEWWATSSHRFRNCRAKHNKRCFAGTLQLGAEAGADPPPRLCFTEYLLDHLAAPAGSHEVLTGL